MRNLDLVAITIGSIAIAVLIAITAEDHQIGRLREEIKQLKTQTTATQPSPIVVVDMDEIIHGLKSGISSQKIDEAAARQQLGDLYDKVSMAADRGALVLNKNAVLAGGEDLGKFLQAPRMNKRPLIDTDKKTK